MVNSQNIVSDLLLGFGTQPVPQQGPTGVSTPATGAGSFASLLSLFSGIGMNVQGATNSQIAPANTSEESVLLPMSSAVQAQVQALMGMGFTPTVPTSEQTLSPTVLGAPNQQKILQASALGVSADKATVHLIAANGQALDLPVREVPEGSYRVTNASITNGNLNLTLVHKDDQNTEFKITLPTQPLSGNPKNDLPTQMSSLQVNAESGNSRAMAHSQQTPSFEQFLTQLKASEVTINQPLPGTAGMAEQAPVLTIQTQVETNPMVAVGATAVARPLNLARTIELSDTGETLTERGRENIKTISAQATGTPKPAEQLVSAIQPIQAQFKTGTAQAEPFFRPTPFKINNRVMTKETPTVAALMDANDIGPVGTSQNTSTLASGSFHNLRQEPAMTFRQDQTAVRVTLPKDLSRLLDGSHKSISIKLDPDYLGPARLSLTMRGEVLTAKITVDTQQAKAALDNSMTQLTDQLANAGVKVDLINVSIRGGGADNQSFHRPQDWFTQHQPRVIRHESNQAFDAAVLEAANRQVPASYLHGRGVNLYA
ncbi:MAG: flagellar hook-length control protein FliK [Candidatus Zixiibacteriota bacterium]